MDALLRDMRSRGLSCSTEECFSSHTSFRIGGGIALSVFPESETQLLASLELCRERGVAPFLVGRGTNLLASDRGYKGVVIFTKRMRRLHREGVLLYTEAGVSTARLASVARDGGLAGLEFLHGIPGTLGGAVVMNAGAYGGEVSAVLHSSRCYDAASGEVRELSGTAHGFGYRDSVYLRDPNLTVLSATLRLAEGDPAEIGARMEELARRRRESQPLELPSAGSVFKRPEGHFAGRLIEDCGLKGFAIGDAAVSEKHAGFIVNRGRASAEEVERLVAYIQQTVYEKCGVELECEIRRVPTA